MSHFQEVKVDFANRNALEKALENMNINFESHKDLQKLNGYNSDAGKRAHVIIRKNELSRLYGSTHTIYNDFGVQYNTDNETVVHMDNTDCKNWGVANYLQKIVQYYSMECIKEEMPYMNISGEEFQSEDGKLVLTLTGGQRMTTF